MRVIVVLAGLLLYPNLASSSDGDDQPESKADPVTEKLVERLVDKTASLEEKTAAVNGIAKRGPKGSAAARPLTSELAGLMKSRTKEGHVPYGLVEYGRAMCAALGAVGPGAAGSADVLIEVLEKTRGYTYDSIYGPQTANDPNLRVAAADALGKIVSGSRDEALREKVSVALEAAMVGDINERVRTTAGHSLKSIRDRGDTRLRTETSRNQPVVRSASVPPFAGSTPTSKPPTSPGLSLAGPPPSSAEQLFGDQGLYSPAAIRWMYGAFGTPYQPRAPVPGYEDIEFQRRSPDALYGAGGMLGPDRIKTLYGKLP